ncbi:MAG: succinate dehydrogenase, hydrophobic membrane anchor protein [Pseudomonadota bacterium]
MSETAAKTRSETAKARAASGAAELRAPLGRVRGLGSAKSGAGHWRWQRITAVVLVPLGLWFIGATIYLIGLGFDHSVFRAWVSEHGNALLLILFIAALFHHAQLGLQVVIEDYVHAPAVKTASLFANTAAMAVLGLSSILAVLRLYLGV